MPGDLACDALVDSPFPLTNGRWSASGYGTRNSRRTRSTNALPRPTQYESDEGRPHPRRAAPGFLRAGLALAARVQLRHLAERLRGRELREVARAEGNAFKDVPELLG